ncbi:MAG: hypothetical protein ACXQTS_02440 [Candidatus Methanospirareceae archaeon]
MKKDRWIYKGTEVRTLVDGVWEEARIFIDPLKETSGVKITRRLVRGDRLSVDVLSKEQLVRLLRRALEVLTFLRERERKEEESVIGWLRRECNIEGLLGGEAR